MAGIAVYAELSMMLENPEIDGYFGPLQALLRQRLSELVPRGSRVAYLDYPTYGNVGDMMIFLGTELWLGTAENTVLGRWNIHDFHFPALEQDVVILCQGGGNFGDLYRHQTFRERVVARYPRNRIVFLPQTIYYSDPRVLAQSRAVMNTHQDLHLLLRDRESLTIAETNFPRAQCYLCPDMAVLLHPLDRFVQLPETRLSQRSYSLIRSDIEARAAQAADQDFDWTGDWQQLCGINRYPIMLRNLASLTCGRWSHNGIARNWRSVAQQWLERSATILSTAGSITSSRLHGHILATLLGIQNQLIDNSYGKNFWYYDTWNQDLSIARKYSAPLSSKLQMPP
jgi:pyruvyl transferase EpsO